MKLFVTGAAGFIGSNYVRWVLENSDDEVTILDALTYAGNMATIRDLVDDRRCRFVHGDICDQEVVLQSMDGHDAVVHFAAETHVDRSIKDGYSFVRTNCFGTNVLCDVALRVGVSRFLHNSTDEVYGSIEDGSFTETDKLTPRSPYSAAKAGIMGFTRALSWEAAPKGVRVNAVAPGPIETDLTATMEPADRQAFIDALPVGRFGRPEEIAATALLLAGPQGGFFVGATLSPNGGDVMY